MMRTAVFRCDASIDIGSGHVMRCLTLAEYMRGKGWNCIFAVSPGSAQAAPLLGRSGFAMTGPDGPFPAHVDLMVVDSYALSARDEGAYRSFAGKILVLDDLADRPHDCDVLLDQTYGCKAGAYAPLVPAGAVILAGAGYALLRPQFYHARDGALARRDKAQGKISRILVSLGSTDPHNVIPAVLHGLAGLGMVVDVVVGSGSRHIDDLKAIANEMRQRGEDVHLHIDAENMAELMGMADLAIGAGGTTSWERCCLGLPVVLIELADNQKTISQNLMAADAAYNLGWHKDVTPEKIAQSVARLIANPDLVREMSGHAAEICDGRGIEKLYRFLDCADVEIRPATVDDSCSMHEWRNSEDVRKVSTSSEEIPYDAHVKWLEKTLNDPDRNLLMFVENGKAFGMLRFDCAEDVATISIYLAPHAIGRGWGSALLQRANSWLAINRPEIRTIHAHVLTGNTRSQRAFLGAGYRDCGDYFEMPIR